MYIISFLKLYSTKKSQYANHAPFIMIRAINSVLKCMIMWYDLLRRKCSLEKVSQILYGMLISYDFTSIIAGSKVESGYCKTGLLHNTVL